MRVVSSSVTVDPPQIDGRFWVHEVHTLDNSETREFNYLADAGTDYNSVMTQRALEMNAEFEAEENEVPEFVYAGQLRRALVQAGMKDAAEAAISTVGQANNSWYTIDRISRNDPLMTLIQGANEWTDEQVDNLFRAAKNL